jgi:hypothetical protein
MKAMKMKLLAAAVVSGTALFAMPGMALAESGTDTTAAYSVAARHNFTVVIPAFLSFRVGTAGATIDNITFSPTVPVLGNSTPVAGAGGTGGGGGSTTDVVLLSNAGQVTITATNNSGGLGLSTGVAADGYINLNEITASSGNAALTPPALSNAGGTTSTPTLNAGTRVTNQTATWTFAYANTTIPSAGTYGGATSGQVTYTATAP